MLERFFLNFKGLFDISIVSITKKEYVIMSDEWFIAICWSSLLLGIFAIKKWLVFSLTSFRTLKYDWVTKTREIFIFLHLINNSVTVEFSFFYESYWQSYHQKLLISYFLYQDCNHEYFDK